MSSSLTSAPVAKVCIVGAGVVGLSSALRLVRLCPGLDVTVVAHMFGTDTTSAGAAGLWGPYVLEGTPQESVIRWSLETFNHLVDLNFSDQAVAAGVHLVSGYNLQKEPTPLPFWKDVVMGFRSMTPRELEAFGSRHACGTFHTSVTCEGRYYLSWLTGQLRQAGVNLQQRKLSSLQDVTGYDVVINCCGLGARELVPDSGCYPVRGQILRVRAPWLKHFIFEDPYYLIPNREWVVLGGTAQADNFSTAASLEDKQRILGFWQGMLPGLKDAEVVSDWVGLRPGRKPLRLEAEQLDLAGHDTYVVHNYGHGGSGLTLAWGCAGEVAMMVAHYLGRQGLPGGAVY